LFWFGLFTPPLGSNSALLSLELGVQSNKVCLFPTYTYSVHFHSLEVQCVEAVKLRQINKS